MKTFTYVSGNPVVANLRFVTNSAGTITASYVDVSYDLLDGSGEKVDGRSETVDVWPLRSASERATIQALYTTVTNEAKAGF